MSKSVLMGKGRGFESLPEDTWKEHVVLESKHIPAVLDFMTREHHLVRYFVVEEIARTAKPVAPDSISATLGISMSTVSAILNDLEKNLFFLVRDRKGHVIWAFPVTAEMTPHKLTFDSGEKLYAA